MTSATQNNPMKLSEREVNACCYQPPPQALCFLHGRGQRETRVTGDEPQGTMGRVQTAGEAPSRPLFPSRLPLRSHRKRDVWVRGSVATAKRAKTPVCLSLIKRPRDLRADHLVYQCRSEATSQFLLTIRRLPLYFEVKQFAGLSSVSCWINSSPGLSSCIFPG